MTSVARLRRRRVLVLLLAANSGAIDATGLIVLNGVFTSVMTGNLILLGVATTSQDAVTAAAATLAVAAFMLGVAVGARIAGRTESDDDVWPRPVTRALVGELGLLVVFASVWWSVSADPGGGLTFVLLGIDAVALGIQSSAVMRLGVPGLSTTYMTGTLTSLVSGLATGRRTPATLPSAQILLALVVGATGTAALVDAAAILVPVLQLVLVGSAVLLAWRIQDRRVGRSDPVPAVVMRRGRLGSTTDAQGEG